jgi:hypothetical protein
MRGKTSVMASVESLHCIRKRGSKQKTVIDREKRRGISEPVCIQSKKACYEGAVQSEAILPPEEKEQAQERDRLEQTESEH